MTPYMVGILVPLLFTLIERNSNKKEKQRGVPIDVAGEAGYAIRNYRFRFLVYSWWEGITTLAELFEKSCTEHYHKSLLGTRKLVFERDGDFCRWEFAYERTMRLWEVLWTYYLSEHMHLYVCVVVLKQHWSKINEEQMDFDTLLKFINELSGHIDLDATLMDVDALCICAGENVAAYITPGTPPTLPIDDTVYPHQEDVI